MSLLWDKAERARVESTLNQATDGRETAGMQSGFGTLIRRPADPRK